MEWSNWRTAQQINYWTDSGIEFTDGDSVLDRTTNIISQQQLKGVSLSGSSTVQQLGSRGLIFSGFGFTATSMSELELLIVSDRFARIVDQRVQLYNTVPLGVDVADGDSANFKTYSGSVSSYWRAGNADPSSQSFGVLLDFAPRPDMPSSNPLIIRSVSLRIR